MGAFVNSVKQIFSSVFGRGDIVHLLEDGFEIDPSMNPESAPGALHAKQEQKAPKQKRARRQAPPSQLSPNAVARRLAQDTFGGDPSLEIPDIEDFDWSTEFGPDDDDSVEGPAALDSFFSPDGAPPEEEQEAPAPADDPDPADDSDGVLRLVRQAGPADEGTPVAMAGTVLESDIVPPTLDTGEVLDAAASMLAGSAMARIDDVGPPPTELWDEAQVKLELLDQLERERMTPPHDLDPVQWTLAIDRLGLGLAQIERELPPLPVSAGALLGTDGHSPSDEEVIEAIKADPSLAGSVVKAANSPFYMAAVPAASLQGALVRLGVNEARRVAVAAAFEGTFELPGQEDAMRAMRRHALATAIACEILGRTARDVDSGQAFLAGLLHDAGELLVHRMLVAEAADEHIEIEVIARLARRVHPRTGALLFGGWDLDAGIAACLGWHHAPGEAEERFAPLCHIVHVGDIVAEIAIAHSETTAWRDALSLYSDRDDPGARERAVATDGIADLNVDPVVAIVPRGFGADRVRGVIRGLLLRMESDTMA